MNIAIIFPHQLFAENPLLKICDKVYLVEEYLFFNQYKFHKQKLAFHRASMKSYQSFLGNTGLEINYIESGNPLSDIRILLKTILAENQDSISIVNPVDYWLEKRIREGTIGRVLKILPTPQFLNTDGQLSTFFRNDKSSFFQTTFYKQQRVRLGILVDSSDQPAGGKWTYDTENRKKYPKTKIPPSITYPKSTAIWEEAVSYIEKNYPNNPGEISNSQLYPINHEQAQEWFEQFLEHRFFDFGLYEDAIVEGQSYLHHSILSPLLNTGLCLPDAVVNRSLDFAEEHRIPLNSVEGFVRQIIGWREFIRGMYTCKGVYSRTRNFWQFKRKIPSSFYDATTGIEPVDETIKLILKTGYCHHIERLMILGNFMLLCEFDPDEVYRWFMEMFIDAYDWVMVPNVYGMSQFADGGTFATKPYIGGSNYLKKMSNYAAGDWQPIWDGLFWRFIAKHLDFFNSNPRISMLAHSYSRMDKQKRETHTLNAEVFLAKLNF